MNERSDTDGKTYTVQYFERAVFEHHPENRPPYDVLLSLLGVFEYKRYYSLVGPANQKASTNNPRFFSQTGKTIGGRFREYWEQNGGLAQQGYPITDEFEEKSRLNDKTYTVQYFERAVFEYHPENRPPYDVLLSHLGTFRYRYKTYVQDSRDCLSLYRRREGRLIGEGTNTVPTKPYQLKSYRLEEVVLPGPITCEVNAPVPGSSSQFQYQTLTLDKAWRLIITSDRRLHVTEGPYWVYFDDRAVGWAGYVTDWELGTIIYDQALLREGATIGVSYYVRAVPEVTLPEKLQFNKAPDESTFLRQRALNLPKLEPGAACPVTPKTRIVPTPPPNPPYVGAEYGLGNGPIYPVAYYFRDGTTLHLSSHQREGEWFVAKVRWIGTPNYTGPVLVRGGQLDGTSQVHFEFGEQSRQVGPEMTLTARAGWNDWPGSTLLRGAGCYAYQVDGVGFSEVIVFRAVEAP